MPEGFSLNSCRWIALILSSSSGITACAKVVLGNPDFVALLPFKNDTLKQLDCKAAAGPARASAAKNSASCRYAHARTLNPREWHRVDASHPLEGDANTTHPNRPASPPIAPHGLQVPVIKGFGFWKTPSGGAHMIISKLLGYPP